MYIEQVVEDMSAQRCLPVLPLHYHILDGTEASYSAQQIVEEDAFLNIRRLELEQRDAGRHFAVKVFEQGLDPPSPYLGLSAVDLDGCVEQSDPG